MNKGYELSPSPNGAQTTSTISPPECSPGYENTLSESIASFSTGSSEFAKPFQFLNLGILAYTGGGSALAQVPTAPETEPITGTGKFVFDETFVFDDLLQQIRTPNAI